MTFVKTWDAKGGSQKNPPHHHRLPQSVQKIKPADLLLRPEEWAGSAPEKGWPRPLMDPLATGETLLWVPLKSTPLYTSSIWPVRSLYMYTWWSTISLSYCILHFESGRFLLTTYFMNYGHKKAQHQATENKSITTQ